MAEQILKNKVDTDDLDDEGSSSKEMSEQEKKNIEYWAKQDPDGSKKKQREKLEAEKKAKKLKEE